ncbi:hypothetical protein [Streptomyces sp. NPDC059371]
MPDLSPSASVVPVALLASAVPAAAPASVTPVASVVRTAVPVREPRG